jgi:hypothetical protein
MQLRQKTCCFGVLRRHGTRAAIAAGRRGLTLEAPRGFDASGNGRVFRVQVNASPRLGFPRAGVLSADKISGRKQGALSGICR